MRSAEVRKFSAGKRRAEFVRGGKAMDGMKRAGSTPLGREASRTAKRGFANRRASFVSRLFMACFRDCRAPCRWQGPYEAVKDARREPESRTPRCEDFVTLWFIHRTLG